MKIGDTVAMRGESGSWGILESEHRAGFYVRWYYGKDINGDDVCEMSSVRARDLVPIPAEAFARYRACRAWTSKQSAIAREVFP